MSNQKVKVPGAIQGMTGHMSPGVEASPGPGASPAHAGSFTHLSFLFSVQHSPFATPKQPLCESALQTTTLPSFLLAYVYAFVCVRLIFWLMVKMPYP